MKQLIMIAISLCLGIATMQAQDSGQCSTERCDTLVRYTCDCGCHYHPVNNYSGLNSLRARLANRSWNGQTAFDRSMTFGFDGRADGSMDDAGGDSRFVDCPYCNGMGRLLCGSALAADSTNVFVSAAESTNNLVSSVGCPVFVFFKLASTVLTEPSQLLNVDAIAEAAKRWHLGVRVIGAADSATGSAKLNTSLSQRRAETIARMLRERGVPDGQIVVQSEGGIATYNPVLANRHCRIILFEP